MDRLDQEAPHERLVVIGGPSYPLFVEAVCRALEHPVGRARLRTFSDGERWSPTVF